MNELAKELANVRIFRRAGAGELEQLASIAKRESFKPNTVVFFQGDRADKLYVILSGGAKVSQQAEDGKQKIIGTLGPGEIFGELTLLDGRERSATVKTIEPTEMLSIAHRDFHAAATKNPELLWRALHQTGLLQVVHHGDHPARGHAEALGECLLRLARRGLHEPHEEELPGPDADRLERLHEALGREEAELRDEEPHAARGLLGHRRLHAEPLLLFLGHC